MLFWLIVHQRNRIWNFPANLCCALYTKIRQSHAKPDCNTEVGPYSFQHLSGPHFHWRFGNMLQEKHNLGVAWTTAKRCYITQQAAEPRSAQFSAFHYREAVYCLWLVCCSLFFFFVFLLLEQGKCKLLKKHNLISTSLSPGDSEHM